MSLPEKFLFFRPSKYPLTATSICVAEMTTSSVAPKVYTIAYTPTNEVYTLNSPLYMLKVAFVGTFTLNNVNKRIYGYELTATSSSGVQVPVYSFTDPKDVFGANAFRCKKVVAIAPAPAPATIAHVAPEAPTPVKKVVKKITAPPIPASPTAPLPATPKPVAKTKAKPVGDLAPFVAKQLLELAQMKHEMCPITAEEFSQGNTAAMPCGHLFMQFAIEETFKKEPYKCPACRQNGQPTYV